MNLQEQYLKGAIDVIIDSYKEGFRDIPAEAGLEYSIEFNFTVPGTITTAKITFKWVEYGDTKCIDENTDSWETEQFEKDDYFTILGGEDIGKLREYVEDVLEKIVLQK